MILTPDQRVRVFISSTLEELAEERAAARRAIRRLHLVPVATISIGASHPSPTGSGEPDGAELPAGTVTFLLTDIEGSTRLWETEPEAMEVALSTRFVPNNHACSTARLASSSPLTPRWKPR